MKILHLSPYYPSLKASHAGGVCMGKEIEELKKYGEVFIATFAQTPLEYELIKKEAKKNLYYIDLDNKVRIRSILGHPNLPVYFAVRSSDDFLNNIYRIIEENHIDIVHAEYASMGQYIVKIKEKYPHIKCNLALHDITAQSFKRQAAHSNGLKRVYLNRQLKKILKYERNYINACDNILVFSKKDVRLVKKIYGYDHAVLINSYLNIEKELDIGKTRTDKPSDYNNICFMGQMLRTENYEAAERLISIYNKISVPKGQLFIVGNNPPEELKRLETKDIHITGYVDDVDEYLLKSRIAVFPLMVGAGIKIKVLHAMALGIPVVTTSIGAEGIDEDGEALTIAKTDEDFINIISKLLSNDEECIQMSEKENKLADENFKWDRTEGVFSRLYGSAD